MSQWEHERKAGHIDAWKELHRRVAADLQAERGEIRPVVIKWAYYDSKILLMKSRVLRWIKSA